MQIMKNKKGLASVLLPLLVFIVCLAVSVGVYWVYGEHNLDSDISSEFVLAQLLNEEGKIVTDNWYYSTEVRIVSPVVIYQLTMAMFPNDWHLARTAAIGILLCIVAASLVYMTRGFGVSYWASLLCAGALVLPVTEYNSFTLVYGGFYTICTALTFLEIGLLVRMDKRRPLEPILLLVLSFIGGLNGVRMLMICAAPLAAACVVVFFVQARKCRTLREMAALPEFMLLLGGIMCLAATFAGNWINANILAEKYSFELHDETALVPLMAEMFTDQLMSLMGFFGYRNDVLLVSLEGVVSVLAVILPVLGMASMALLLTMKLNTRERLAAVFMPIALLLGITINVLTLAEKGADPYPYNVSYYMPAAMLLIFAMFWALDRFECRLRVLRVVPMLGLVGCFLAANSVYRDKDMNQYANELEYVANWLADQDVTEGYATYWNANALTELTDGRIEVYMVEDMEDLVVGDWLQRKDHMDKEPEGKVFAIFDKDDWENGAPGLTTDYLAYSSDELFICIYEDMWEFDDAREAYGES